MARTLRSDKVLVWEAVALVFASLVMVTSATAVIAGKEGQSLFGVIQHQLPWAVLGFLALFVMMRVDYHQLRRPVVIWSLLGVTVVALLAVFLFEPRNNATRWIAIQGLTFQPSELAKVVAIIFAAAVLERRMHRVNDFKYTLAPIAIVIGVLALLIVKEPDLGTPIILVAAVLAMLFAAGLSARNFAISFLLLLPMAAYYIATHSYRVERLLSFIDPSRDPLGAGYQVLQSQIAIGAGGLLGLGLGNSVQKRFFLPEPQNDFIFSVIGEEFGLLGTTIIVIAFGVIAWRGLRAALLAPDRFGALLGVGLAMMVAVQAFVNMSVAVGIAPNKGLPLPLVSQGGSSLLMNLIAMGILLNITQQASVTAATTVDGR